MDPQFWASVIVIAVVLHLILLMTSYLIMLERKSASWIQDRIGPNRTGFSFGQDNLFEKVGLGWFARKKFYGLGQPLADGIKFLLKEDYTPPFADKWLFSLAPLLAVATAMLGWAVIPWGGWMTWGDGYIQIVGAPLNIGAVYILGVSSLAVYGVVLGGYASNNKYAFLGSLRATAQMLSYEIPMGLCVLIVGLMAHSLRADTIIHAQAQGVWYVFYQPILFVMFFICMLAETNRAPFDLAEAEQELVGGYHTEYSSMRFALFFLGEYIHMITGAAFLVMLFLGGWDLIPFLDELPIYGGIGLVLLKALIFFAKVVLVLFVVMWIRWTLPRFRFDQLMRLAWRTLIPVTLLVMLASGVLEYLQPADVSDQTWNWTMLGANIAIVLLTPALWKLIPEGPPVNRRIPLEGSRFSPPPATPGHRA